MVQTANQFLSRIQNYTDVLHGELLEVSLHRGEVLHEPGEPFSHVYFLHDGAVSEQALLEDGAGIECLLIGNEGVVGAMSTLGFRNAFTRNVCRVAAKASCIQVPRLRVLCGHSPPLREALHLYCGWKMSCALRNAACNGRHTVEQRLSRWLLACSDLLHREEILLTQDALAEILGVQRTSINPVLRRYQGLGILALGRERITILNRGLLRVRACECYESAKFASAHMFDSSPLTTYSVQGRR